MKNIFKTLVAVAAIGLSCLAVEAGQPVVWTATFTNSFNSQGAGLTQTNPLNIVWSSQGAYATGAVDTLQSSVVTAYATVTGTGTATLPVNGTLTFNAVVSPDGTPNSYVPALTNLVVNFGQTNALTGNYVQLSATPFRYWTVTNVVSTVTNTFFTNANISVKLFIKQ